MSAQENSLIFEAWPDTDRGDNAWLVRHITAENVFYDLTFDNGRLVAGHIEARGEPDATLGADDFRSVPVREARRELARHWTPETAVLELSELDRSFLTIERPTNAPPPGWAQAAASAFLTAELFGDPVTVIAQVNNVPRKTAQRWAHQARGGGLLDERDREANHRQYRQLRRAAMSTTTTTSTTDQES